MDESMEFAIAIILSLDEVEGRGVRVREQNGIFKCENRLRLSEKTG